MNYIGFPNIGIQPFRINNTAFAIGSLSVKWYGVIIVVGMILGCLYAYYRMRSVGIKLDDILDTGLFGFDDVASSAAWIQAVEGHGDDEEERAHHHEHEHHHEGEGEADEYGIGTFVYQARRPFDLNRFDHFVAKKWPGNVIRAKGICYFSEEFDNCYLFEQAGRQFVLRSIGQWFATMPEDELTEKLREQPDLLRDWDAEYGDRMQKLVFIGQHLDADFLQRELDDCLS